jgi:iron complex outermembrane receptor protein
MQIDVPLAHHDLTSIAAWRDWDWNDGDDTALPLIVRFRQANRQEQLSQDIRIASRGAQRVDYMTGVYLYRENVDALGLFAYGVACADAVYADYPNGPCPPEITPASCD